MTESGTAQGKYQIELKILGLPKTVNNTMGQFWRARYANSKKWRRLVQETSLFHKRPTQPLTKAIVTLQRYSSVAPDFDGLVSSFKPLVDGLVDAGIISGDTMDIIGAPTYQWFKVKPKEGYVVIKVEAA